VCLCLMTSLRFIARAVGVGYYFADINRASCKESWRGWRGGDAAELLMQSMCDPVSGKAVEWLACSGVVLFMFQADFVRMLYFLCWAVCVAVCTGVSRPLWTDWLAADRHQRQTCSWG
jgi:hypothetical protein